MSLLSWLQDLFSGAQATAHATSNLSAGIDDEDDVDPYNPFPEIVEIAITDVIDLHTIPPRDVGRVVEEYLEQSRQNRFATVRIIHGKGIGVQREIVRTILARTPFVIDWTDAPPEAGGLGATIVHLKGDAI